MRLQQNTGHKMAVKKTKQQRRQARKTKAGKARAEKLKARLEKVRNADISISLLTELEPMQDEPWSGCEHCNDGSTQKQVDDYKRIGAMIKERCKHCGSPHLISYPMGAITC